MNSYKDIGKDLYLFLQKSCYLVLFMIKYGILKLRRRNMDKYKCVACGYIYDDAVEKVKFVDLPEDWVCPLCGVPKSAFIKVEE